MRDRKTHISLAQEISLPGVNAPGDVRAWLLSRGWGTYNDDVWSHQGKAIYDATWEQAVAYEYFLFVTLGGHDGKDAA